MCANVHGFCALVPQLFASVYQAHAPAGSSKCEGVECFRESCLVCATLSAGAAVLSLGLWRRLQRRYGTGTYH